MADLDPLKTRPPLDILPFEKALEPLQKRSFITLGPGATPLQRTWAAFSGDKNRLDLGDVFHVLANPSLYGNVDIIRARLLEVLGYQEGAHMRFKALTLGPGQQLALSITEPEDRDTSQPTLVFVAGFAHPASLYMTSLSRLAKVLGTKVVVMDLPGNGGSQSGPTVDQTDFYKALKLAITSEINEGEKYHVGGHSLGCSPVYRLFREIKSGSSPVGKRELARAVIINPVPTWLQETSGAGYLSRKFMVGSVGSQASHGFGGMKAVALDRFTNETPSSVTERTKLIVGREDVPISTLGMMTILTALDADDPVASVGSDKRLAVILSNKDRLMNWDTELYKGHRGYRIISGDHGACLIGPHISAACTKELAHSFQNDPDDRRPPATAGTVYRSGSGVARLGLVWRSDNAALVFQDISVRQGLLTFGTDLGTYVDGGIKTELGYRFGNRRGVVAPQARIYLGTEGLRLPVDVKFGAYVGIDFADSASPLIHGLVTALGINLTRIFDIEAQARFTFSGQFQDLIAGIALRFL